MTQQEFITEITKRLVPLYKPLAIYLYGEKDWGIAADPADVELTIIVASSPYQRRIDRAMPGYEVMRGIHLGKLIFVLTKEEFDLQKDNPESPAYYAKHEGMQIYANS
ncbi:hypothetical protein FJ365_04800 [Candidatus Dependentiae bacterium]|nr:hypothetical protein [Candidatus Dependentiae bacterium]